MAVAKVDSKKAVVYLAVAFLAVSVWNNPDNAADRVGDLLGDAGHLTLEGLERGADFLSGLVN